MTKNEQLNPLKLQMYQTGVEYVTICDETQRKLLDLVENEQIQAIVHINLLDSCNKTLFLAKSNFVKHVIDMFAILLCIILNKDNLQYAIICMVIYNS